jgi:FkbM family methyltransferase
VELEAGAKKVIAVEPEPMTYGFLSKTLNYYSNAESLNLAISDKEETLRLFVANQRNCTTSSKSMLLQNGLTISEEINAKATTIETLTDSKQISMIRTDVEGSEYRILSGKIPDQVKAINLELHVIPPFDKSHAQLLLKNLYSQGFELLVVINEMNCNCFPLVNWFGFSRAYRIATALLGKLSNPPNFQVNLSLNELLNSIPKIGEVELLLHR